MPDDLQQNFATLNQKLDMFMQYYKDRHEDLENRVDKMERRQDVMDEKINNLHNSSMAFVNEMLNKQTAQINTSVQDVERRIADRIEANSRSTSYNWITIASIVISAFIGAAAVIVALVALFR